MSRIHPHAGNSISTKALVICCVMLAAAITGGWMLSARPMNGHECFVSVTAREMLQSGDWVVPTYNGRPRLQKTPLNYWLVAVIGKLTGTVNELAARLPSVLLAVLSTAAVLYFCSQWLNFRTAVLAALFWSTSLGFVRYAHSARPEMALTCFVAISFLSFYSAATATNRKKQILYALIFWLSFSLAMLAKGPAPLPLILVPVFLYVLIFREWKLLPKMLPISSVIIFLAIVLPWPILLGTKLSAALDSGGGAGCIDFWKREFVSRFLGTHDSGGKPVYYYLPVMFQFMLPWAAFVPMGLIAPFYRVWDKKRKVMWFSWLWFVGDVVFMSISGGKRMHYILPATPAMAILAGILAEDLLFSQKAYTKEFARNFLLFHAGALIAGAIGLPIYAALKRPELLQKALILGMPTLVMIIAAGILFARKKNASACGVIFAGYCVLLILGFAAFVAGHGKNRYSRDFAVSAAKIIPQPDNTTAYRDVTSRFVHYFGRGIPVAQDLPEARQRYTQGHWIIATGPFMDELISDGFQLRHRWNQARLSNDEIVCAGVFHQSKSVDSPATQ